MAYTPEQIEQSFTKVLDEIAKGIPLRTVLEADGMKFFIKPYNAAPDFRVAFEPSILIPNGISKNK